MENRFPPPNPEGAAVLTSDGLVGFMVLLIVLAIAAVIYQATVRDSARKAYDDALWILKRHPLDFAARADVLEKGRRYSKLTMNSKGILTFDESAIRNDIDLAVASRKQPSDAAQSPETRLLALDRLLQQGLISQEEYGVQRSRILSDI